MRDPRKTRASMMATAACAAIAMPLAAAADPSSQATPAVVATGYATLHALLQTDGTAPYGELVQAKTAAIYGTTFTGGANDAGTVFRWAGNKFSVLHAFTIADGQAPAGGVTLGTDGNLYGVTGGGGQYGFGTAYKLTPAGVFTLLHSFGGPVNDGAYPYLGTLAQGADGNFYGTTLQGGAHGLGVAFRMTPAGAVTVMHAFAGGVSDGASPRGQLIAGSDGLLHGTTLCGGVADTGNGCGGTLYNLSLDGAFTITHRFGPADAPQAPLLEVGGALYGTTSAGGAAKAGTVFKTSFDGQTFTTLHEFAPSAYGKPRTADGAAPIGRLMHANDGNIYGTTSLGGINASTDPNGDGTIFRVTPLGVYSVVQSFGASIVDGARPYGGLIQGQDGNLYGTTHNGATQSNGSVYKLALPARQ